MKIFRVKVHCSRFLINKNNYQIKFLYIETYVSKNFHLYYCKKVNIGINISFENSKTKRHILPIYVTTFILIDSKIARRVSNNVSNLLKKLQLLKHIIRWNRSRLSAHRFFFFLSLSKSRLHAGMRSNTLNGDQTVASLRKVIPDIYETLFIIHHSL